MDDAPHTTCVGSSTITSHVQPEQKTTMRVFRPSWMRAPEPAAPAERTVSEPFTTATYKRRKKGSR